VTVTRLAIGFGVVLAAGLCTLAALGSRPAIEVLVTVVALVVLVGGGNWINGRGQPGRGQPGRGQPGRGQPERGQPGRVAGRPPSSTFEASPGPPGQGAPHPDSESWGGSGSGELGGQ